jgi:Co/Zn/Cd efflux system component
MITLAIIFNTLQLFERTKQTLKEATPSTTCASQQIQVYKNR